MMELAAIRPDDWNFPLLLHILGAMVLVGALILVAATLVGAWRGGDRLTIRLGFRALLWAAIPSYLVMRIAAQVIADKEGFKGDGDPAWIGIGYMTSESSLLLIIIATVLAGIGARKARLADEAGGGEAVRVRGATVLVGISLLMYLVAIWAMTTKPL